MAPSGLDRTDVLILALEQSVDDGCAGQTGPPDRLQIGAGLDAGAEQAGFAERSRKGQPMRNDDQGGEQVAIGQNTERMRPEDRGMRIQQHRRDDIDDEQDDIEDWNEDIEARQLDVRERQGRQIQRDQSGEEAPCKKNLPLRRRLAGDEQGLLPLRRQRFCVSTILNAAVSHQLA